MKPDESLSTSLFTFHSLLRHSPRLVLRLYVSQGSPAICGDLWRRFARFSCPVRTHHTSFVLNDLECARLHRITPFAECCAPIVHQPPSKATAQRLRN